jgi:hypothetical protein
MIVKKKFELNLQILPSRETVVDRAALQSAITALLRAIYEKDADSLEKLRSIDVILRETARR